MMIEEVKSKQSASTIFPIQHAYFYCKHGNPKKNSFLAIAGTLIAQLVQQNPDLSSLVYEIIIKSGDTHLTSRNVAEELLTTVLTGSSASHAFVIIDGLDECETPEDITNIIGTLIKITEPLNAVSPGAYRLFFTSTDENSIRRQLSRLSKTVKLKIRPQNNEQDIKHYITAWSLKIQNKFRLSDEERQNLESNVMSKTNGKFIHIHQHPLYN